MGYLQKNNSKQQSDEIQIHKSLSEWELDTVSYFPFLCCFFRLQNKQKTQVYISVFKDFLRFSYMSFSVSRIFHFITFAMFLEKNAQEIFSRHFPLFRQFSLHRTRT